MSLRSNRFPLPPDLSPEDYIVKDMSSAPRAPRAQGWAQRETFEFERRQEGNRPPDPRAKGHAGRPDGGIKKRVTRITPRAHATFIQAVFRCATSGSSFVRSRSGYWRLRRKPRPPASFAV